MPTLERPPRRSPASLEDDPLAAAFPVRRSLPAFLLSAAFHGVLLVVLATISFAVVRRDEKINVKIIEPPSARRPATKFWTLSVWKLKSTHFVTYSSPLSR